MYFTTVNKVFVLVFVKFEHLTIWQFFPHPPRPRHYRPMSQFYSEVGQRLPVAYNSKHYFRLLVNVHRLDGETFQCKISMVAKKT